MRFRSLTFYVTGKILYGLTYPAVLFLRLCRCWGYATALGHGQLSSYVPVVVDGSTDWASVTVSYDSACATKTNGSVYCWQVACIIVSHGRRLAHASSRMHRSPASTLRMS